MKVIAYLTDILRNEGYRAFVFGTMSLFTAFSMVSIHGMIQNHDVSFALGIITGVFTVIAAQFFGTVFHVFVKKDGKP